MIYRIKVETYEEVEVALSDDVAASNMARMVCLQRQKADLHKEVTVHFDLADGTTCWLSGKEIVRDSEHIEPR